MTTCSLDYMSPVSLFLLSVVENLLRSKFFVMLSFKTVFHLIY
jgi:hypothetical protein